MPQLWSPNFETNLSIQNHEVIARCTKLCTYTVFIVQNLKQILSQKHASLQSHPSASWATSTPSSTNITQ